MLCSRLFILPIIFTFVQVSFGATCAPSKTEIGYAEVINKLSIVSLWGSFPSNATFSINDEIDKSDYGYYVINDPKESKALIEFGLADSCNGHPLLFKIKGKSNGPQVKDRYFPGCSSVPNENGCVPPLKDYYDKFKKNVGQEVVLRKKITGILKGYGFKHQLNDLQIAIANSAHEIFHSYRVNPYILGHSSSKSPA